jgi:hypothetical protein
MTLANIGTMRAGLLLGLGYLGLQLGHPQSAMAQPECSEATLRGTYIYSYDGFTVGKGGEQRPFAFSGIESYDGAGTMTGIFSVSTNGVIDEDVLYTGTYTVNADCTGELTLVDPVFGETHYDQFVDPSGDEFRFVQTDEGVVASGSGRRVSAEIITFSAEGPGTP